MPTPTGDHALIKKINTAIVLECILRDAPLSRADISARTGLNKATVSSLVQDLMDRSLVLEIGHGASSGGRKPVMLIFNRGAGYAVGIDLGVNYIRGVLTDLEGSVLEDIEVPLSQRAFGEVLPELSACIRSLIAAAPPSPYGVVGIGIGVPGLVDAQGTVLFAPHLRWQDVDLQAEITETFGLPVTIDNEANLGALGEQQFGAGRGIPHLVYISAGIGIGTGLILNGALYKGASGYSGELGHLSIEADGAPCSCGNRGCWELYASEQALLQLAAPLGYSGLRQLLAAAEGGSAEVQALFGRIGESLGVGIASIVNVFNPDAVILGNRLSRAEPWISGALSRTLEERALPYHRRSMRLLFAELKDRSAMMGAASSAIARFFHEIKGGVQQR